MKSIRKNPFYGESKEHILPVTLILLGKEAKYHLLSTYVQML